MFSVFHREVFSILFLLVGMSGLSRQQEPEDVHLVRGTNNDEICDNLSRLCSRLESCLLQVLVLPAAPF